MTYSPGDGGQQSPWFYPDFDLPTLDLFDNDLIYIQGGDLEIANRPSF